MPVTGSICEQCARYQHTSLCKDIRRPTASYHVNYDDMWWAILLVSASLSLHQLHGLLQPAAHQPIYHVWQFT